MGLTTWKGSRVKKEDFYTFKISKYQKTEFTKQNT